METITINQIPPDTKSLYLSRFAFFCMSFATLPLLRCVWLHSGYLGFPAPASIYATTITLPFWQLPALVGGMFTALGLLKVYGLAHGTIGGRDRPLFQYATGTCPTWVGRGWKGWCLRVGFPFLLLGIGFWNLADLALQIYARTHPPL